MRLRLILGVLGALLLMASTMFLCGLLTALIYREDTWLAFLGCFVGSLVVGGFLWLIRAVDQDLRSRDAFLVVSLCYVVVGLTGSIPFLVVPDIAPTFTDGVFESVSGFTTTGASVLSGLDDMPHSVLLYRQLLQWVGGMGIIVLAVAILPLLGVGGVQLYRAEAPGSEREMSMQLRVRETAKALWLIYVGLTVICTISYQLAGMSIFDAICYAFSTVAIGGFSPHDSSFLFLNSRSVAYVAIVFMFISGINFLQHYLAFQPKKHESRVRHFFLSYLKDSELRLYVGMLVIVVAVVAIRLGISTNFEYQSMLDAVFHAVSFATTTGFTTADYGAWPLVCPAVLLFASFIGGCTGSTAGGIKVYRVLLLARQGIREIRRLIQPGAIFSVTVDGLRVKDRVLETTWGFLAVYAASYVALLSLILLVGDLDFMSAFSAVAGCLNNLGPGLGQVADSYQSLSAVEKWILMFAMILGRLEIFTVLVLFAPRYWRR